MATEISKRAETRTKAESSARTSRHEVLARRISATGRNLSLLAIAFLFLIGAAATPQSTAGATAQFVGLDTTSQGNWQGKYGSDGYAIANSGQSLPPYALFGVQGQMNWTWNNGTSDPRALETSYGSARMATTWYQPGSFTINLNLTDGSAHQIALYALDWDGSKRSETVQVVDANSGTTLDTRSVSNFANGTYLIWNISGNVQIVVTRNSGDNAVISAVFFSSASGSGAAAPAAASASFVRADVSTQGNWRSVYGGDGYSIATATQSVPSYATFTVQGQSNWVWTANTNAAPALQANSGRLAATWYSNTNFNFDVNFTDGAAHTFAIYALDFDNKDRSETIRIVDANSGVTLNSQNISSFTNGMYLVYTITGHVKVSVTSTCGPNAVISGVFFGTVAPAATAPPVTTPVAAPQPIAAPAATLVLTASASSLNFGAVTVSQSAQQTATLTNAGTGSITISSLVVAGAGFNASGASAGVVLSPGQSATLTITFAPASSGSASGSIVITSNATGGANTIGLTGTGAAQQHAVTVSWAPSSSSNVMGYNTYYSTVSGGPYAKLNASPAPTTVYKDSNITSGETRYYVVTSVNSSNEESSYSGEVTAIVP